MNLTFQEPMKAPAFESVTHPFLTGMTAEHREILARISLPVTFDANELIFREGEMANRLYLILNGAISIETEDDFGDSIQIQVLEPGEVLGWSWLIPPENLTFSARALEPASAIFIYGTKLREACHADPVFGYEILKRIAQVLVDRLQATRRLLLEAKKLSKHAQH